jgi:DeoR/GlpR family transcriptional regulator of sugar metabolism
VLVEARRARILADAIRGGGITVRELTGRFEVSVPTLRRDLSALADQGLLRRVHGGAMPAGPASADAVGTGLAWAAALVEPGMAVGISGGRRAMCLAGLLGDIAGLTVVTPVLAVARAVRGERGTEVVLVGGVRTPSGSHAGPVTERTLRALNLDLTFVEPRRPGDAAADRTDEVLLERAARRVHL